MYTSNNDNHYLKRNEMKKILTSCLVAAPLIVMAATIPDQGTNGGAMVFPEGKLTINYR